MLSSDLDPSTESNLQVCLGTTEIVGRDIPQWFMTVKEENIRGDRREYGRKEREEKTPQMEGHAEPEGSSPLPLGIH